MSLVSSLNQRASSIRKIAHTTLVCSAIPTVLAAYQGWVGSNMAFINGAVAAGLLTGALWCYRDAGKLLACARREREQEIILGEDGTVANGGAWLRQLIALGSTEDLIVKDARQGVRFLIKVSPDVATDMLAGRYSCPVL